MGRAILPPRLKDELAAVAEGLAAGADLRASALTAPHAQWVESFRKDYVVTEENAWDIVKKETGMVFAKVLEHVGVYARNEEGREAFLRFLQSV